MVSPADGTVTDIETIEADPHLGGPALRIGIFLSVFNVHVNRAPCDGRVVHLEYKKGKFVNALKHATASADNEANTIVLAEKDGQRRIATVKQIVGLIARAILPGRQSVGIVLTIVLGIVGAFVGGLISSFIWPTWTDDPEVSRMWPGWIMSILGAVLVLWAYVALTGRRGINRY